MVSCPQPLYPQGKSLPVSLFALANLMSFAFVENVSPVCVCVVPKNLNGWINCWCWIFQ